MLSPSLLLEEGAVGIDAACAMVRERLDLVLTPT